MEQRPVGAFILSLIGGLFLLVGTVVGALTLPTYYGYPYQSSTPYDLYLAMSAISGILVLLAAALLYMRPGLHVTWGIMVLIFSIAGVFGSLVGLFALFGGIGVAFGIIGGALAIAWGTGSSGWPGGVPPNAVRMCTGCGHYVPMMQPFCPYCGTPGPTFPPRKVEPVPRPPNP